MDEDNVMCVFETTVYTRFSLYVITASSDHRQLHYRQRGRYFKLT